MIGDMTVAEEYWEGRYTDRDRMWSGQPNGALVREAAELPPGRALDLGCGEGADVLWLARRGWRVVGADVSRTALERGARHAADAGVADRVDMQWHDFGASFPEGAFDLVTSHYLHSPTELPREEVLRRAAAAVAPGGVLLVVGHSGDAPWRSESEPGVRLPTPEEVLEQLRLAAGAWQVLASGDFRRLQRGPDGQEHERVDNLLKLRRLTA